MVQMFNQSPGYYFSELILDSEEERESKPIIYNMIWLGRGHGKGFILA